MQLLLIECDPSSSDFLAEKLAECGFRMQRARSVEQVLRSGLNAHSAAVILEIRGAGGEARDAVKALRAGNVDRPLIVLSSNGDWRDKVECLDAGADDILFKPVRSEELAARVRAVIRRSAGNSTDQIVVGDIELDLKAKRAWRSGKCLDLTRTEFRLLSQFLLRPQQVLTPGDIHDRIYPDGKGCSLNAIEVQIARLRRKIGRQTIRTIRGVGYRYASDVALTDAAPMPRESCLAAMPGSGHPARNGAEGATPFEAGWSPCI